MDGDVVSQLRRALHSGDGELMVAAVAAVGSAGACSWSARWSSPPSIATRPARKGWAAVVWRRFSGARGRLGTRSLPTPSRKPWAGATAADELIDLPVEVEGIAELLDAGSGSSGGRIDLLTGEVWPEEAFDESMTGVAAADEDEDEDEDRWLVVWPAGSRAAFRDMADFAASRIDTELAARLEVALDGRGAFRRFKNVLLDWPEDREEWFTLAEDRSRGRARAWLADNGYRAHPVRPTGSTMHGDGLHGCDCCRTAGPRAGGHHQQRSRRLLCR